MPQPDPPIPEPVFRDAAAWFARNRGPDAEAKREEFEEWLRGSAVHRSAYARAAEIFAMGKHLADEQEQPPGPRTRSRRALLAGAAAIVAAAGALFLLLGPTQAPSMQGTRTRLTSASPLEISTRPGEERTLLLPDGSAVRLSPSTVIEARMSRDDRHVELRQGTARFRVKHDGRPFSVRAAGGVVIARGTVFEVSIVDGEIVTVHLLEGAIDVTPAHPRGDFDAPRRLRAGESLRFAATRPGGGPSLPPARVSSAAAPNEPVEVDSIPLATLVDRANRDAARPIRLEPGALAGRRISGRFRTDDTRVLAERIATLLNLRVETEPSGVLLLRSR